MTSRPAEATEDGNAVVFNWRDIQRDGFLYWLIPTAISGLPDAKGRHEEICAATDDFKNVRVTMQVNGIEVPAKGFLELIERNMDHGVRKAAQAMVSENSAFAELNAAIRSAEKAVRSTLFTQLAAAGVDVADDEEEEW